MIRSLRVIWTRLLNLGFSPEMDHLQLMRLRVVNGLVLVGSLATFVYGVLFFMIGTIRALEGILVIPVLVLVLILNHRRHYVAARLVTVHVMQVMVFALALADRRTGTEYILLVLALTSIIVFERQYKIIIGFFSSCAYYLLYVVLDHSLPFTPNDDTPYMLVNNALIFLCGIWVASLMLIFRSTTFKYADDVREAANEIGAMNASLQTSNQQLFVRSEHLDMLVRRKTKDLQIHKDAIDAHMMVIATDREGRILSANQKSLELLGYTLEQMLGRKFNDLDPGGRIVISDEAKDALNAGRPFRSEVSLHFADRPDLWVDMLAVPLEGTDGDPDTILYLSIPISAQKALELVHARALVGLESIAHRTSHEIRGPIARILGLSLLLERGLIKSEEMPDIAGKMIISANELNAATSALTEFILEHERELGDAKG